jgi:hypothetical protein
MAIQRITGTPVRDVSSVILGAPGIPRSGPEPARPRFAAERGLTILRGCPIHAAAHSVD